jgi:hypothetical protein
MHGGFHITKAIAAKYEISLAEAELVKIDKAFLATPGMQLNADQKLFSDVIAGALNPALQDFDQTLMAYASRFNQQVDQIYLSGGTSLMPGLAEMLSARWNKKVLPLHVLSKLPQISIRPQKNIELLLPTAIALGISQVRSEFKSNINFRTGALRREQSSLKINWQEFISPLKLAFIAYTFAVISLGFQYLFLQRDLAQLQKTQESSIKRILSPPNASALTLLKSNPTRIKQNVDKKVADLQLLVHSGGASTNSSLEILQDMSRTVTRASTMEIKEMNLQGNTLSLKIEAPTQKDAESALKTLSTATNYTNAKPSAIEAGTGTRKKFSISLQVLAPKGSL